MADMDSADLVPGHNCNCAYCKRRAPAGPASLAEKAETRVDALESILFHLLGDWHQAEPSPGVLPRKPVIPGWVFDCPDGPPGPTEHDDGS